MNPRPIELNAADRALLPQFEQLYARWRTASDAAAAAGCALSKAEHVTTDDLQHFLDLRAEAQRCLDDALQLLRDRPL
jgi:hypothetical protein